MMHLADNQFSWRKKFLLIFSGLFLFTSVLVTFPKKSEACCTCVSTALSAEASGLLTVIGETALHVIVKMLVHKKIFFKAKIWNNTIERGMKDMSDQLAGTAMQQTLMIGQFFDAEHQMGTQRIFQELQARVHRDYQPTHGLCEVASNARSLASSERIGELNQEILGQRTIDRQLGNANTLTSSGTGEDKQSRINQFKVSFCNPADHGNALKDFCTPNAATSPQRYNKDIDFARTVNDPLTLDLYLYDNGLTANEAEVFALGANLYTHTPLSNPESADLARSTNGDITNAQGRYLDNRAMLAKMNVAENSFNAITSMKSRGSPGAADFVKAVMQGLGVPDTEVDRMVGENPSYYAQMEVLTKKMLQDPKFYTDLYDKPVNVERKGVALQAIGLMQKFDLFKSHLRNEANLAVLLELQVSDMQDEIENKVNQQKGGGRKAVQ